MRFIKEFFVDMADFGFIGWVIIAFMTLLMLFLAWGLFIVIDSAGIETQYQHAQVVDKSYHPAYTTVIMVSNGNGGMTPVTQYYPESWSATVVYRNHSMSCSIDQTTFHELETQSYVKAAIGSGRISGNSYCDGIQL